MFRTKEHKDEHKPIYKIGFNAPNKPSNCPRSSEIILLCKCMYSDHKMIENTIEKEFNKNFKQRKDLGNTQTFEGDPSLMRDCILDIIYTMDNDIVPMDLG